MKNWTKKLMIVVAVIIITVIGSYLIAPNKTLKAFFSVVNLFTSKPATAEDSAPKATYKSTQLLSLLTSDTTFTKQMMDQNIAIEGVIKEVKEIDYTVTMECGESAFINFSFDSLAFVKCKPFLLLGKQASLKGIYVGFDFPSADDEAMSLLPPEKNIFLKSCFLNK